MKKFKVNDEVTVPANMFGPLRDSGWVTAVEGNWATVYVENDRRERDYHFSHLHPMEVK